MLVTNCFSTQTSYENQTKKAINNNFIQEAMTEFFRSRLQVYFIENKQRGRPHRRAGARQQAQPRDGGDAPASRSRRSSPATWISPTACRNSSTAGRKDVGRRELYIVEGDSAMGSVKLSRDAEFQGIMPVRGKILNCLKADYDRIFKSEIITDLLRVLGCGVEVQAKATSRTWRRSTSASLRWSKVVICTDADVRRLPDPHADSDHALPALCRR